MGLPFYHGKQYLNNRNHTAVVIERLWVLELERKNTWALLLTLPRAGLGPFSRVTLPSALLSPSIKWVYLLHTDVD